MGNLDSHKFQLILKRLKDERFIIMQARNMSLTFNQNTGLNFNKVNLSNVNVGMFSVGAQATNTFSTITTTNGFNAQFKDIYNSLNDMRQEYQQRVNELLASGSDANDALINKGVELAWKYEQAELKMGGKGTSSWSDTQKQEILNNGKVRGAEGHHINNVADHPSEQANPDNIKFARDRDEHLRMHDGNFQNSTDGDMINRNSRLKKANNSRVFKNELAGIGAAAAIGLGVGFTLGFIVTLAQSGVSTENLRNAAIVGGKTGVESATLGVVNHLLARGIGEIATNALQGVVQNLGITVTENITKMCNMGVMGGLAIIAFSVYQFTKLKLEGYDTKECLLRVSRSAAFSITTLALAIIAQGLWGGHAGMIVSIGIGVIVLVYKFTDSKYQKQLSEKIRIYTIEKCLPAY